MVGNDLTARILERGLAASSLRHQVTANNIANLMTPGFKGSHVDFEEQLSAALASGQAADMVSPAVVVDQTTTGRPDGNNVDVEGEMVVLGANQIWYSAMTRQLSDHFARLTSVIHDGRRWAMQLFRSMQTSASALTAGRLQMDLIADNLANINTTRGPNGQPYRRRFAVQEARVAPFQGMLDQQIGQPDAAVGDGVRVAAILEDAAPYKLKHDPTHPDADANGMVRLPNVDLLQEITDMMMATRVYEANVTALNAGKTLAMKALDIGR